jgi:hypothetical protein
VNFTDLLCNNLCGIIRQALGMAANTIRPAKQHLPIGNQGVDFGTVLVLSTSDVATPELSRPTTGAEATDVDLYLDTCREFLASVNFYRARRAPTLASEGAFVDAMGIMEQSQWAFDQASRLPTRFWIPSVRILLQQNGISFLGQRGPTRDLTELNDSIYESRGQVDLEFGIVNREVAKVQFLAALNAQLIVAGPGGDVHQTDIEVPIP